MDRPTNEGSGLGCQETIPLITNPSIQAIMRAGPVENSQPSSPPTVLWRLRLTRYPTNANVISQAEAMLTAKASPKMRPTKAQLPGQASIPFAE